jgi:hypothetical protein
MDVTARITGLDGELRQLITKWDRFFSGDIRVPPLTERDELGRRLRVLSEHQSVQRVADRYRLEQLQHRFMAYSANWERLLREREEGFRRGAYGRTAPVGSSGLSGSQPNASRAASVDQRRQDDLFDRWSAAKRGLSQDIRVDQAAFEAQIENQRRQLEKKLGAPVVFDVKVEDDKVKLTARRVRGADGEE